NRRIRVRHVGNGQQLFVQSRLNALHALFQRTHLITKLLTPPDEFLLAVLILLFWNALCYLIGFAPEFLQLLLILSAILIELHHSIGVGLDVTIAAIGFHGFKVVADEMHIQHGWSTLLGR